MPGTGAERRFAALPRSDVRDASPCTACCAGCASGGMQEGRRKQEGASFQVVVERARSAGVDSADVD